MLEVMEFQVYKCCFAAASYVAEVSVSSISRYCDLLREEPGMKIVNSRILSHKFSLPN